MATITTRDGTPIYYKYGEPMVPGAGFAMGTL